MYSESIGIETVGWLAGRPSPAEGRHAAVMWLIIIIIIY